MNSSLSKDVQLQLYFRTVGIHIRSDLHPVLPNAPKGFARHFPFGNGRLLFDHVCDKATTVLKVPSYVTKMSKGV